VFHLRFTRRVRRWLIAGSRPHEARSALAGYGVRNRTAPEHAKSRLADPPGEDHDSGVVYQGSRPAMDAADWCALGFSEPEAAQLANLRSRTHTRTSVVVMSADGVAPLAHYRFHSPTGFEWGYSGSGPADLARCILLHHCGVTPARRGEFYPPAPDELPVRYQAFKFEVISRLAPEEPWALSSQQIAEWIQANR
jgi:hypothetical protein